jgi:hypothetical protein
MFNLNFGGGGGGGWGGGAEGGPGPWPVGLQGERFLAAATTIDLVTFKFILFPTL